MDFFNKEMLRKRHIPDKIIHRFNHNVMRFRTNQMPDFPDCHTWNPRNSDLKEDSFEKYALINFVPVGCPPHIRVSLGVHRLAWILHYGGLPPHGGRISHTCGNRLCCNVQHLKTKRAGNIPARPDKLMERMLASNVTPDDCF